MPEIWSNFGFYLWALTTALVIIMLAWLAWLTFGNASEPTAEEGKGMFDAEAMAALTEQVNALTEAAPLMQSTLGRTLQYRGLVHYPDQAGAQAFSLAVLSARGDGFVLSSSVRGGLSAKPIQSWNATTPLSAEEQSAIDQARGQKES